MLMRTQASVARRAHKSVRRLRRASFRTFNLKVSALGQVWCVTSMALSLTTIKNWFLLDYLSFYLLSLLMYARRHWRVLEFTIKLIKILSVFRKIFRKNGK
jgi:hypothetical protein